MKKILLSILFFFILSNLFPQDFKDDTTFYIYKKVQNITIPFNKDIEQLALKITSSYGDEESKVLAIAYWIMNKIKYDYDVYINRKVINADTETILKKKKTVCSGYSLLFKELCEAVDINAQEVGGYIRDVDLFPGDTIYRAEHAWNIVKINQRWSLMDLTWACSETVPRKQFLSKTMALLFGTPYTVKYKAEKRIDLSWINVEPEKMILTHLPELYYYQLLSKPIFINTFQQGEDSISYFLKKHSSHAYQDPGISWHLNRTEDKQCLNIANKGYKSNPNDHRVMAYYHYLALLKTTEELYDPETEMLNADSVIISRLSKYIHVADSFLNLSIADNNKEYSFYSKRNNNWKNYVKKENKEIKKSIAARQKKNIKQKKMLRKLYSKNQKTINYTIITSKKFNANEIMLTKKPYKETLENYKLGKALMKTADSIYNKSLDVVLLKDSFINIHTIDDQNKFLENEYKCLEIHKMNHKKLSNYYKNRKSNPFLFYTTLKPNKEWFKKPFNSADSINTSVADSLLSGLLFNQKESHKNIKIYVRMTKEALKTIKNAKKKSTSDNNEDSIYVHIVETYKTNMYNYVLQIKNYSPPEKEFKKPFDKEIAILRKSTSLLNKDDILEVRRHANYKTYRKKIKDGENNRAKYLIKDVKAMGSISEKTNKNNSKEKP